MKRKGLATLLAATMVFTAVPGEAFTDVKATEVKTLSYDGYNQVWADEFSGDSLNRDDWNVELHEKGWVNNELQEYVDSDENIEVKDGNLYINPVKTVTTVENSDAGNLLANADFSSGMEGWTETIANWGGADGSADASSHAADGTITYNINNVGNADWNVQLKQSGIELVEGHEYNVSFKATSTVSRKFKTGVMSASYEWFGGCEPELIANEEQDVAFNFLMGKNDAADFYISLGEFGDGATSASDVTISDIKFVDVNASTDDVSSTKEIVSYTSGRISTQNKETFTYGLFEVRAKVPEGQGYLPAFWLMSNDENIYGQWPRCGEIDCMEVMGQDTQKVYGTIHYGNPHSESQGTYLLNGDDSFSNDFHTFQCEWEPGVIKWYVDGVLYHEESDWYSTTVGQGTLTYPAPFDQPFYMILNLAVGGSWVGNPNEETSFDNNPYVIDYVRVYQKDGYDENVTRPEKEVNLREPNADGNYINNGDFSVAEDLADDADWKFMTALEGDATASIADNTMSIKTTNEGTVDYSVQLVQADLPLEKGATYEVSFDAYSSADREMGVDIKAPDHGYMSYMPHQTAKLTTEKQTYTYTFKMGDASDANGRLEYNMGATGSTEDINISNVSVKKIAEADPNEKEVKTVLANGNYVYNGNFQEGANHLGYWNVSNAEDADVSVTNFADGRRLKVTMDGDENSAVVISQDELAYATGTPYELSFVAESDVDNTIVANVGGHTFTAELKAGEKESFSFTLPSDAEYTNNDISFTFGTEGTTYLDNVSLVENAMIKNGSFNDGTTGYTVYVDSSAKASHVVDSLKDDNALAVTVENTGDQDWKVQIKQENVKLVNGKTYKLTFKAKSSLDRKIRVVMQGQENRGWSVYSNDNIVDLTSEYQTFEDVFTMNEDTDTAAFFSVCLGKIDDEITTLHEVRIDDITLEEVVDKDTDDSDITDDTESTDKDDTQIDEGNTDNTGDSEIKDDESNKDDTNNNQTPVVKPNKVHETIKEVVKTVAKVVNEVLKCIKKIFKFF